MRKEACPACGTPMTIPDDAVLGEVLFCPACDAEIELISLDPLRLDLFEEEEK